jgi:adenosine deaminase
LRGEGLGLTLHAGEADAPQRVLEAVRLGARRIGHGVRLADLLGQPQGDAAVAELRAAKVHLEICPTSNVQTGAAMSIATHPIRALWSAGVALSFHTDNRLISHTSASAEAAQLVQHAGFAWDDLARMGAMAADASFLGADARAAARAALQAWQTRPRLNP